MNGCAAICGRYRGISMKRRIVVADDDSTIVSLVSMRLSMGLSACANRYMVKRTRRPRHSENGMVAYKIPIVFSACGKSEKSSITRSAPRSLAGICV